MTDTEYWNKMVEERNAFKKQNEVLLKLLELYKKHFDLGELYRIANNFPHLAEKMGECISELETAEYEYERTINGK